MKPITMRDAIRMSLAEEMRMNKDVFLIGEDIGAYGGTLQLTIGLFDEFGPERVIDTPLSEYAIIGTGIGAALMGMKPVVEIMFADFLPLIADQLINNAAKICYAYDGEKSLPLVIRAPFGAGTRSGMHHCQSLEGMLMGIPGLKMVMPTNPSDAKGLLKAAIADPNPVIFFEHKLLYGVRGVVEDDRPVLIGKASVLREGSDLSIVACGPMVQKAIKASEKLEDEFGIKTDVIDLRTIKPLDVETILTSVKKTGRLIIAHEASGIGGINGEIALQVANQAIEYLDGPIMRVCAPDTPVPFSPVLEDYFIPSAEDIFETANALLRKK